MKNAKLLANIIVLSTSCILLLVFGQSQKEDTSGSPRIIVLIAFTGLYLFGLTIFTSWIHEGSSKISIMMVGFILGGGLYGPTALYGIMAVEAAPAHLSGTSHAIVSMASSVGAVLSGLPMSVIASILNWKGAFRSLLLIGVGMLTLHIITRNWPYKLIPTIKKLR